MSKTAGERPYVEVTGRLNLTAVMGANLITVHLLLATWGDWGAVASIAGIQIVLIPFNIWVNLRLLSRLGVVPAEGLRTAVNLAGSVAGGLLAGWPFPVWFWIPFVALAFDPLTTRAFWTIQISFIVVMVTTGLLAGASWIYGVSFASFGLFCATISSARLGTIRLMLLRSDLQREALEIAHDEVQQAHEELVEQIRVREHIEVELRQAQKLEAVGRLAAGVAHEINTPVQFVGDSVQFVRESSDELLRLIAVYREARAQLAAGGAPDEIAARLAAADDEVDLEYLVEHLPGALARSLEGIHRIATIVRSMKDFAHPDQKEKTAVDINHAIQTTLTIARGEYKHVAEVETSLEPVPPVPCHAGEINQVLLNLIVNAAHAIEDRPSRGPGRILVRTRLDSEHVVIEIQDTGSGIPPEIADRIFDPFFTTKEVGRGTGQGLAIARSVVQRHGGTLTFESRVGAGTTFSVRLPVRDAAMVEKP
jgi:signal transduction histidine kinase